MTSRCQHLLRPTPLPRPSAQGFRRARGLRFHFGKATLNRLLLVFGWFLATGTHWDVLQVTAWAGMWTRHVQKETIIEATAATFSGDQLCSICELVQSGKNDLSPEKSVIGKLVEKSPLILPSSQRVIVPAPSLSSQGIDKAWRCPPAPVVNPPAPPPRHAV